jgi:hypothetical protein
MAFSPSTLIPGVPEQARKQLAAFEWAAIALVTLGYGSAGARLPRPRRYAGVLLTYGILGLVADMGKAAARLAGAAGGTLLLALLLNQVVSGRLIQFLGPAGIAGWFGTEADPPPEPIAVDTFAQSLGVGGPLTAPPPATKTRPGGGGGGGGGAW